MFRGPFTTLNSFLSSFLVSFVCFPLALLSPQGRSLIHNYTCCLSLEPPRSPLQWLLKESCLFSFIFSKSHAAALCSLFICLGWSQAYPKNSNLNFGVIMIVIIGVIRKESDVEKNEAKSLACLHCSLRSSPCLLTPPHGRHGARYLPISAYQNSLQGPVPQKVYKVSNNVESIFPIKLRGKSSFKSIYIFNSSLILAKLSFEQKSR